MDRGASNGAPARSSVLLGVSPMTDGLQGGHKWAPTDCARTNESVREVNIDTIGYGRN